MKSKLVLTMGAMAMMAGLAQAGVAQASGADQGADKQIVGVWRCEMHGLPAVTLTVTDEGGSLTGAVLFYLHKMAQGQAETATPGVPEPIFHPSFDGKRLTFEVSHRRAHPPQSLDDAPMRFEVRLNGDGRAELVSAMEDDPKAPRYFMEKSAY